MCILSFLKYHCDFFLFEFDDHVNNYKFFD